MIAAFLLAAATPASGQADLDAIGARGRLIYEYDQAAWHSTDAMLAKVKNPERKLSGYIVEPTASGYRAIYYQMRGGQPVPVYTADVTGSRVVSDRLVPEAEQVPLAPKLQRMIQARSTAMRAGYSPCAQAPFNTVVLAPASDSAPVETYLLTPQSEPNSWPLGGHYRVTVSQAGKISSKRAFMKTCMLAGEPPGQKGAKPVAMVVSHLLDPVPTEIHVFTSLASRKPVYVVIGEQLYSVEGTRIRSVKKDS